MASASAATAKTDTQDIVRLYVATPCYGCMMTTQFMLSLMRLQAECNQRGIECVIDLMGNESLVQRARNVLVGRFLKSTGTHFLFIDADIGFDPHAVFRLIESNKDIVTGVYPKKAFNWEGIEAKLRAKSDEPVHMAGLDYNINLAESNATVENGFIRVLDSATGFMLIRRHVLESMATRFASTLSCVNDLPGDREDPAYVAQYVALFDCMIDPKTKRYLSEDYAFVRRAQEAGYDIWADLTSPLCHVGTYMFEGDLRQRFSLVYAG